MGEPQGSQALQDAGDAQVVVSATVDDKQANEGSLGFTFIELYVSYYYRLRYILLVHVAESVFPV